MTARTTADLIREADAKAAAIADYTALFDRLAEQEQIDRYLGLDDEAELNHRLALLYFRAMLAEDDDPQPPVRGCGICGGTTTCVVL